MPFVLVIIGAVILVAALRNTQGTLATALETDVPGFAVWALALAGVGALGFVPGMRTISRGLIGLVLLVLVLRNYQAILAGFQGAVSPAQVTQATPDPAAIAAANPASPQISAASVSGTGTQVANTGAAGTQQTAQGGATSPFDPAAYVQAFASSAVPGLIVDAAAMGFGGVA